MTGFANKLATLLHQLHIVIPNGIALNDCMGTFAGLTSDMGNEMSMPFFRAKKLEDLLPPWINREPLTFDLGNKDGAPISEASQDLHYCFLGPFVLDG